MTFYAPKTLITRLRNLNIYLNNFPNNDKSAHFEYLCAQSLARILSLPFYTLAFDDPSKNEKVIWNGSINPIVKSPPGPDCLALAHNFNCVVEFTRRTGANQWTREGAQLFRHTDDAVRDFGWSRNETYSILIVTRIARDTYVHLRGRQHPNYKILLLETDAILRFLKVVNLAFSLKNIDLRDLFAHIIDHLKTCPSVHTYRNAVNSKISEWSSKVLESEKKVFIGIKAYEVMNQIGRMQIGQMEIYRGLLRHPFVLQYMKLLKQQLTPDVIIESLIDEGLAKSYPGPYESILNPILPKDFSHRQININNKVTSIWT